MRKFKVGDRVRTDGGYTFDPNEGVITSVNVDGDDDLYTVSKIDHPHTDLDDEWCYRTDDLSPVAVADQPQLTIQAGKYYRTRDGRKVGPMEHGWDGNMKAGGQRWWTDGRTNSTMETSADLIAEWVDEPANDNASTAGFTVPVFDEDDFDICGHRDSDGDIVQLSVGELTAALADSLKVARKVGKTIKRGDLVTLARPALVTGVDRYHASVQTDGGNYSLPLAALTAA